MPDLLRNRIKEYIEWLKQASIALRATNIQIDEFVKQQNALKLIEVSYPRYKNKIEILGIQFDILKENNFDIKKDDDLALKDAISTANSVA